MDNIDKKNTSSVIKKRRFKGIVVSDKMDKTIVVRVDVLKKHSRYHKYFTVSKNFKAHDEENKCKIGDRVIIEECRPLSKEKRWIVKESVDNKKQENIQQ